MPRERYIKEREDYRSGGRVSLARGTRRKKVRVKKRPTPAATTPRVAPAPTPVAAPAAIAPPRTAIAPPKEIGGVAGTLGGPGYGRFPLGTAGPEFIYDDAGNPIMNPPTKVSVPPVDRDEKTDTEVPVQTSVGQTGTPGRNISGQEYEAAKAEAA